MSSQAGQLQQAMVFFKLSGGPQRAGVRKPAAAPSRPEAKRKAAPSARVHSAVKTPGEALFEPF